MKRLLLAVLLVGPVVMVRQVAADFDAIKIHNLRKDTVKVCAYINTLVDIPLQCWTLAGGESVMWDRGRENQPFRLHIFRPALLDEVLCEHKELKDVSEVGISPGCRISIVRRQSGPAKPKPAPKPAPGPAPKKTYTFHPCNSTGTPVQFALGYGIRSTFGVEGIQYGVEGWWIVPRKECLEVRVSDLWKAQGVTHEQSMPLYLYAKSGGGLITQFWEGRESDLGFCVNQTKRFTTRQFLGKFADPCKGANLEVVRFLEVQQPIPGELHYTWVF